jgi:uncharacterized membrane protein YtjA (UPF0391 family)
MGEKDAKHRLLPWTSVRAPEESVDFAPHSWSSPACLDPRGEGLLRTRTLRFRLGNRHSRIHHTPHQTFNQKTFMLGWSLTFLVVAIVAAVFGFTGIAETAAGIAKIIFFIFLVLLVISLLMRALRGKPPPL